MRLPSIVKGLIQVCKKVAYRGNNFYCPICKASYIRFLPYGAPLRENARCPVCGALERHRLLWESLGHPKVTGQIQSSNGGRLLHVAPETCIAKLLSKNYQYVSVDMWASGVDVHSDITAFCFPDECFDAIICNHVLEHVPADRKALSELYRVLKQGGWASIQVPMMKGKTYEDLSVVDPDERVRLFGQSDHVRQYGDDFRDRLREAGFDVLEFKKEDFLDHQALERLSVDCEESVILVRKLSKV